MSGGKKAAALAVATLTGAFLAVALLLFVVLTPATNACESQSQNSGGTVSTVNNKDYKPPEHSDDPVAEQTATFMESIALDDSHGYSQPRRGGDPDYDCSSAVFFAVRSAGVPLPGGPFTTYNEGQTLTSYGFVHLTWSGDYHQAAGTLKRGDIVVNPVEHTEVYVGGGLFAGAEHACPGGIDDGRPGDQCSGDDQEISIHGWLDAGLNEVYRHDPNAAATGTPAGVGTPGASSPAACRTQDAAGGPAPDGTNADAAAAQAIAKGLLPQYFPGVDTESEYGCLVQMWTRESGWNLHATNPSSGAYGIPQSLPGSKMASAGDDWQTNATTQIKWGLGYIQGRYATPCGAWSSWQSKGWY